MISFHRIARNLATLGCVLLVAIPDAALAEFGKMVKVAGDRQIVVQSFPAPKAPFTVKVVDSNGSPLAGVPVHIQSTLFSGPGGPCAHNVDEFGFAGFHASSSIVVCGSNGSHFGGTDAAGLLTLAPSDFNLAPSAFLIGAAAGVGSQQGVPDIARIQYFSVIRTVNPPAGQPQVVVEYFHDGYRNYFNTIDQAEIDALDAGTFAGWTREVGSFIAWPSQAAAPPGAVPVVFGSVYASHFYTADPGECDAVVANFRLAVGDARGVLDLPAGQDDRGVRGESDAGVPGAQADLAQSPVRDRPQRARHDGRIRRLDRRGLRAGCGDHVYAEVAGPWRL